MTSMTIKIDSNILAQAKIYGEVESRSAIEQIEYWAKIGKISQDNPDLTYEDITEILLSMAEVKAGLTMPYKFE